MKTIYTDEHRHQDGKLELIDGKFLPAFEMPRRAQIVIDRVKAVKLGPILSPEEFGLEPVKRIHDKNFVEFLRTAWDEWIQSHGAYDALPLAWHTRGFRKNPPVPEVIDGKLGYYAIDAGTPIIAGTWRAMHGGRQGGARPAPRLVARPASARCSRSAGRPAITPAAISTAAIASSTTRRSRPSAFRDAGAKRVAILDVDYHHGNGTQEIFYDRADVLTISLHADPRQEYPFFLGHADETRQRQGRGLPPEPAAALGHRVGPEYEDAMEAAMKQLKKYGPDVLVVSLGLDTFKDDPISKFKLEHDDYLRIGEMIAAADMPTLFVMEGGYAVDALGVNTVNVLTGFEQALRG